MAALAARGGHPITDADLGYGDMRGVEALRAAPRRLPRTGARGRAEPGSIVVTCGYSQGLGIVCQALAAAGAKRIAFENPTWPEQVQTAARAGLEPMPVGVDEAGCASTSSSARTRTPWS